MLPFSREKGLRPPLLCIFASGSVPGVGASEAPRPWPQINSKLLNCPVRPVFRSWGPSSFPSSGHGCFLFCSQLRCARSSGLRFVLFPLLEPASTPPHIRLQQGWAPEYGLANARVSRLLSASCPYAPGPAAVSPEADGLGSNPCPSARELHPLRSEPQFPYP